MSAHKQNITVLKYHLARVVHHAMLETVSGPSRRLSDTALIIGAVMGPASRANRQTRGLPSRRPDAAAQSADPGSQRKNFAMRVLTSCQAQTATMSRKVRVSRACAATKDRASGNATSGYSTVRCDTVHVQTLLQPVAHPGLRNDAAQAPPLTEKISVPAVAAHWMCP